MAAIRDVKSSSWPRPRGPKTGLGLVITGPGFGLVTVVALASSILASWLRSFLSAVEVLC